jgi:putative permease
VIHTLRQWIRQYFSDPEAIVLFFVLLIGFGTILTFGRMLAPVLASVVIAYLLEWVITQLQYFKMPRFVAVLLVFVGFLGLSLVAFFMLLPLLWKQWVALFDDLPQMLLKGQALLSELMHRFPAVFSQEQIHTLGAELVAQSHDAAKMVLSASWSSIAALMTSMVYVILVPLLVFFLLKDKTQMMTWAATFLPRKRGVLRKVSTEVNDQVANYIRGKVLEILLVGISTYGVFWYYEMRYAVLLASLVGLSVLIPYVGAILISIPVLLVGYLQWGWGPDFGYCMLAYGIVQALDGNVLVPLLFSEAVNLHPVAIIIATLFFGGIWGFWGVFFAIPLATLVKAVLSAWPRTSHRGL